MEDDGEVGKDDENGSLDDLARLEFHLQMESGGPAATNSDGVVAVGVVGMCGGVVARVTPPWSLFSLSSLPKQASPEDPGTWRACAFERPLIT